MTWSNLGSDVLIPVIQLQKSVNALDKLIGAAFLEGMLPLRENMVFLSGRLSFELVQKSLMAQVPVLAAVSAPSSLAIALAKTHGQTLVGFMRNKKFNIYSGRERVCYRT
ncbi:MAG: formate dehydrogenase accessory sulfurtransferase FdhD [Bacteroidota bacterium]